MNSLFQGNYDDFNLSPELKSGLTDLGYTQPTFVQSEVFSKVLSNKDFVVQSHTGSGKTTAFCLPTLKKLQEKLENHPQVLILAPTRELARQVSTECSRLGHHAGIKVATIYGGASFEAQAASLKAGAQVVVGTPGRMRDLLQRGILDLSNVETAILDEADEMLSMGFWEDVTYILDQTSKSRQTLLFSATLPWVIEESLSKISNNPETLNFSSDKVAAESIRHVLHTESQEVNKTRNLLYAIELHKPTRAIVFCNTKDDTEFVHKYLGRFSFKACALNGDMSQNARERVIQNIKSGEIDIVVATDVAARGIDIPGLSHVFNYDLPDNSEVYVHRTGRTGRMGNLGVAISLVSGKDIMPVESLKNNFEINFEEVPFPAESEILWMQGERLAALLTEQADGVEISQYRPIAASMLTRGDISEILAFLLRSHFSKPQKQTNRAEPSNKPQKEAREKRPLRSSDKIKDPKDSQELKESSNTQAEQKPAKEPEQKQIYITLGREDGFDDLTQLAFHISELSGIDMGHFTGMGNLRDTSSHLEIDTEVAEAIKEALHGKERASGVTETLTCEIASGKPQRKPQRRFYKKPARQ